VVHGAALEIYLIFCFVLQPLFLATANSLNNTPENANLIVIHDKKGRILGRILPCVNINNLSFLSAIDKPFLQR